MTPDFREGLIGGLAGVIAKIQDRLKNGALTPETARELQMLAEEIRMDMREAERG